MFDWVNDDTRLFMSRGYLINGESVEDRCRDISQKVGEYYESDEIRDKVYEYLGKGYYSLSSPVWSNFGRRTGLPISCNGVYIDDSIASILSKVAEIGMQTKHGAGTSAYLGKIRARGTEINVGGKAYGPVHFAELLESTTEIISQGSVRKGNCAVYLDVTHPDIFEFLNIREEGSPLQNISFGVCIPDSWMQEMIDGNASHRKLWARILKRRFESGYPYIFWSDTVNNNAPDVYKDKGLRIHASNLCSEIALHASEDESFVCNLMSMNLLHYDKWKNTDAVRIAVHILDAVMEDYIERTSDIPFMTSVNNFAKRQRALGLGTLGYHSMLQSKHLPFESTEAKLLNVEIHKHIYENALAASQELAEKLGEPELLKGYGRRNTTLCAIAPTTSSSFILGQVSPSIEPLVSNYFTKDLAKGKFTYKNPYLENLLESKGKNDKETWDSILAKNGSVMHLDFLDEYEKGVFKTFEEISQLEIVIQAAQRQKYIDQSQSLNLMIHPNEDLKEVNKLMIEAWKLGVKTLYYQRGSNPVKELVIGGLNTCVSCQA